MSEAKFQSPSLDSNRQSEPIPTYSAVLASIKDLVVKYTKFHMYSSALFYAEKYLNLAKGNINAQSDCIFDLANCLYFNKEYSRCVDLIQRANLVYNSQSFLILYGQSLLACEDYETIMNSLDKESIDYDTKTPNIKDYNFMESLRYLIVAKAYEMQENKPNAAKCYIQSLQLNSNNIEAFDALEKHHLMDNKAKKELIDKLTFKANDMWLYDYYKSRIDDNIYMKDKSEIEMDININITFSGDDNVFATDKTCEVPN